MKTASKKIKPSLAAALMLTLNMVAAEPEGHIFLGTVNQHSLGTLNHNKITITTGTNASIGGISQQVIGSANFNSISLTGANISAGLLHQIAGGHGSINELVVGDEAGSGVSVSLGNIIQQAYDGEVNVIHIGSGAVQ